jgi:hypothetical protein
VLTELTLFPKTILCQKCLANTGLWLIATSLHHTL